MPVVSQSSTNVKIIKFPETVEEAVERLIMVLETHTKEEIKSMTEDDLVNLHFSLGMAIRNAFGLHEPGSKLMVSCGVEEPDEASGFIILELWKRLNRVF